MSSPVHSPPRLRLDSPDYPAVVPVLPADTPVRLTAAVWCRSVTHALAVASTDHPGWFNQLRGSDPTDAQTLTAGVPTRSDWDPDEMLGRFTTRKVLWDSDLRRKALRERSAWVHPCQDQAAALDGRVVAVTGHRNLPDGSEPWVRTELARVMSRLDPTLCLTGMALGVDMIWAETALEQTRPCVAYVPFPTQTDRWPEPAKARHTGLLAHMTEVVVTDPGYSNQAYHHRNHQMIRRADTVVAVLTAGATGGTAAATREATRMRRTVIRVDPTHRNTVIIRPDQTGPPR